jgi:uncharacterized protein YbjT (DUF2867 family)
MKDPGHRYHDLGGRTAGPCVRDEHEYEAWEKRVDALMMLLWNKTQSITVDELRRYIEELGPVAYDGLGYYERWMHSITQALLQRGVLHASDLGAKMEEIEAREHGK